VVLVKKRKVVLIILAVYALISITMDIVAFFDRDISDKRYEEILQAIIASPKSVELKQNGNDITNDFLDKYTTSIENEDYSEAIDYLRENNVSIGISINDRNKSLLDGKQ
jgi:hypothetical protein